MSANIDPIFPVTPNFGKANTVATANTSKTAASGTVYGPIFTAGANGARLDFIRIRHLGTNIATVLRVFINNGSDVTTAANNVLYTELTIAANTVSEVAQAIEYEITMDIALPATYRVYVTTGTTIAAGLDVSAVGGNY